MTLVDLVAKNLFRKRLRTILTIVAIFVAFFIFGILAAFNHALNSSSDAASANRLMSSNKVNFTQPMPLAYVTRTRSVEGVKEVSFMNWFGGYYQDPKNFLIAFAVEPESFLDIYPDYGVSPADRAAFLGNRSSLLVGEVTAKTYGWKVGDRVPLKSNIWRQKDGSDTWDFTIAGIMRGPQASNYVLLQYEYFRGTRSFGGDTIGTMIIKTTSPKENERVIRKVDEMFANSPFETETRTEQAYNKAFIEQRGDLGFIITAVVGAAFATILLIVGNTMMLTVRERTNEIAVLKTIGFTSNRLFGLVLAESLLLALAGGLLGVAAAWLLTLALSNVANFLGPMTLPPSILAWSILLMALLGFLTGFLPALRAMRLNVVSALGGK